MKLCESTYMCICLISGYYQLIATSIISSLYKTPLLGFSLIFFLPLSHIVMPLASDGQPGKFAD